MRPEESWDVWLRLYRGKIEWKPWAWKRKQETEGQDNIQCNLIFALPKKSQWTLLCFGDDDLLQSHMDWLDDF